MSSLNKRKRRGCPFTGPDALSVDYKDIRLLQRYLTESGKIIPSRVSNVSAKPQRDLSKAIKRARLLALLPYQNS